MRLAERFKRLTLWNKLGVVGAVASIIGVPLALVLWHFGGPYSGPSPPSVTVNVSPNTTQTDQGGKSADTTMRWVLTFSEIEPIPQAVNRKLPAAPTGNARLATSTHEIATFRVRVANQGSRPVTIERAELLVDKSSSESYSVQTMAGCVLIDHRGHIKVATGQATVGDLIPIPLRLTIGPDAQGEFTVWFTSPDAAKARKVRYITGRLRLHHEGGVIISEPIELEIHSEHERG